MKSTNGAMDSSLNSDPSPESCRNNSSRSPVNRDCSLFLPAEPGMLHFANVHVHYTEDDRAESWESKRVFRHAVYPTYLVHVRSKKGVLEVYRAVYPMMEELEKQTRESLDLAKFYKDEP